MPELTTESALPPASDAVGVHGETAATLTERLADYVVTLRLEAVPADVVEAAKERLVHHLGLALRANKPEHGADAEKAQQGLRVARLLSRAGGDTAIIGQRDKVAALDAVFANAMLIAGMDDGMLPAGVHPGVVVIPVALAVAEHQRSTGSEFIAAVIAGYDILGKLARPSFAWTAPSPRRPNEIFAPLGAAATAARLMELSREQAAHALAHAANMSMGLVEGAGAFVWTPNPLLARNGLMAATMAQAGLPMWPTMLEGGHGLYRSFYGQVPPGLETVLAELGQEFEIPNTIIKRERWHGLNVVAIQLAVDLKKRHAISPGDIAAVTLALPIERRVREEVYAPERHTAGVRFLVAVVLTQEHLNDYRLDEELTPDRSAVLDRIQLVYEEGRPIFYTRVEISLRDGRRVVAEGDSWGREHFVFPRAEWGDWLRDCAHGVISPEQVARLERLIVGLDGVDDMEEVIACLVPDSGPTGVPAA